MTDGEVRDVLHLTTASSGSQMDSLPKIAEAMAQGRTTSRALVEACFERYADPSGEGRRVFLALDQELVRKAADRCDRLRAGGRSRSPFEGVPIAIKDLFDVAGERTRAGSRAFDDRPPAERDAPVVARLRAAGFLPFGRTNMTEFAYSGLGLNPHFGTPRNPWRRDVGHIPGGSTSGGAVAVADGMAPVALGSDTGGSCRIPAAFCGIVGFKPTAARIPLDGVVPLSRSFDSVGSLGVDVDSCAVVDAVLAGDAPCPAADFPLAGAKLAIPQTLALDGLMPEVAAAFEQAVRRLSAAGAHVVELPFPELAEIPRINSRGGIVNAEAWGFHRSLAATLGDRYDPWVLARFDAGKCMNVADYVEMLEMRRDFIGRAAAVTSPFDALLLPTVAVVPPTWQAMQDPAQSAAANLVILRNTLLANFLDRCAISIPCHGPGEAPVGAMLIGENGADRRLLALAKTLEPVIRGNRR
jgi:aspartyl-tRNA(Asn)/glutamyl-tRNA(Gln) amidotransferase subunit A